jgi:hypothetical protein
MTEEEVKELCPKAERITITGSTIAMRVGEFSQAINVDLSTGPNAQRKVKDLYLDLQAMNREMESQQNEARSNLNKFHGMNNGK